MRTIYGLEFSSGTKLDNAIEQVEVIDSPAIESSPKQNVEHPILHDPIVLSFPEGGLRAWLTVAGSFAVLFVASGFTYGYGVFIISWIGSSAPFIHSTIGIVVGKLYDDGYFHQLMILGSGLYVTFLILLSVCTEYYQVFLCQGLGVGIATGLMYQPAFGILSHYFQRRRAFVMGIATAGASLGGVVYPIMLNHLFADQGFGWGVRIAAFMILGILIFGNLVMRTRLPTRKRGAATMHAAVREDQITKLQPNDIPKVNYSTFFNPAYCFTTVGAAMVMMGITLPFSYLQVFAQTHHAIGANLAFYVLSIMMAASTIGAPILSLVADRFGVLNMIIICATACGGLQFSLLGATSATAVVVISILYGFFSSGFQALMGPMFGRLSLTVTEIGHRMGYGFFVIGIGSLIGPPIQGALLGSSPNYTWWKALLFAALAVWIGATLVAIGRRLLFPLLQTRWI